MQLGNLNLDCKACNKSMRRDRGCFEDSPIPGRWQINDYKFEVCPLKYIDREIYWYIKGYNFMEKGLLPGTGGWLNQPNKFMEAMVFISKEVAKNGTKQVKYKT